jgi:hypothetical protein
MPVTFDSAADLDQALRRGAAARGRNKERSGHPDPDWPDRCARYMEQEPAGHPGQVTPGAGR